MTFSAKPNYVKPVIFIVSIVMMSMGLAALSAPTTDARPYEFPCFNCIPQPASSPVFGTDGRFLCVSPPVGEVLDSRTFFILFQPQCLRGLSVSFEVLTGYVLCLRQFISLGLSVSDLRFLSGFFLALWAVAWGTGFNFGKNGRLANLASACDYNGIAHLASCQVGLDMAESGV